jgi:pimeloyl-ACP methyl ester carboxylesterase
MGRSSPGFWMVLLCSALGCGANARVDEHPSRAAADREYRELNRLVSFVRARNAQQYALRSPRSIDEARFVRIGGIDQWVEIRGRDRHNPVLLFLHGGPGDVTTPWAFALFAAWEERFTVVQWDQRGAGRTLRQSGASIASTLTPDRMAWDGIELTEYLRRHLGVNKVVVVAHSFGSIIGLRMARARPDLFSAYVGTGQVADNRRGLAAGHEALVARARALGNGQALEELTRLGPPSSPSDAASGAQRRWANAFEGADRFLIGTIGLALVAPGNSVKDINDSVEGQLLSAERLVPQTSSLGPADLGLEFEIPVFIIQGAEDFTTPTELARHYLDSIAAPIKAFVPIDGAGHFAVFMRSDRFLEELVRRVRPLAIEQAELGNTPSTSRKRDSGAGADGTGSLD